MLKSIFSIVTLFIFTPLLRINLLASPFEFRIFISFKNSKRLNDEGYTLIDFRTSYIYDKFTISVILNNILDTEYSETNLVPMPGFNSLVGIKYSIN